MKKIILAILILGLGGAGIGLYLYNKPVDKMKSMKVDASVTAEQLFQDYELDESSANTKYIDKVLEVKGTVIKASKDSEKATILLDTGDMLANIMCQMEDISQELPEEDAEITVKGLCTGYLTDVVLIKAIIIKS